MPVNSLEAFSEHHYRGPSQKGRYLCHECGASFMNPSLNSNKLPGCNMCGSQNFTLKSDPDKKTPKP